MKKYTIKGYIQSDGSISEKSDLDSELSMLKSFAFNGTITLEELQKYDDFGEEVLDPDQYMFVILKKGKKDGEYAQQGKSFTGEELTQRKFTKDDLIVLTSAYAVKALKRVNIDKKEKDIEIDYDDKKYTIRTTFTIVDGVTLEDLNNFDTGETGLIWKFPKDAIQDGDISEINEELAEELNEDREGFYFGFLKEYKIKRTRNSKFKQIDLKHFFKKKKT